MVEARRKRRDETAGVKRHWFDASQLLPCLFFAATALVIILICFVGQSPAGPRIIPNQVPRFRIVAEFPFEYVSQIRTKQRIEQQQRRIAPVYSINDQHFQQFTRRLKEALLDIENVLVPKLGEAPRSEWPNLVNEYNQEYRKYNNFYLNNEDILILLERTTPEKREQLIDEAILVLREILREPIIDSTNEQWQSGESTLFRAEIEGRPGTVRLQTEDDAVRLLSINLAGLEADGPLYRALVRIMRKGIAPNLEYREDATAARIKKAEDSVQPVVVKVNAGDVIVEPGVVITPEQVEMNNAYRKEILKREEFAFGFNVTLMQRSILTIILLLVAVIYTRVGLTGFSNSNRLWPLSILLLITNLALLRIVQLLGDAAFFSNQQNLTAVLPLAAPVAFASIVATIMIGAAPAVLIGLLVSAFFVLMQGLAIDFFLAVFLSNLIGIYFCRDIRLRTKVVRAATMSGLTMAVAAVIHGTFMETSPVVIGEQVLTAIVAGVITGILVIGVLPLLENTFKYTTDITLLELTDFNHPLLRKLQMIAPGTYHHSLMVANLAERAAAEVGGNPLLCRATCLFHDIGKMSKPEYFVENQRDGYNPHDEKNPTMSALIIKSHVKEGVEMAKQFKLPKIIIDIIQQHHGTTLIKYFYLKAVQAKQQQMLPLSTTGGTAGLNDDSGVDEASFRYDGPRPRFKESAIIFFADAVEAASRSLKKVTPQSVEELIDNIFNERIADNQLDEAPLTLEEIHKIKASFCFTLLNMLHSRVEYPKGPKDADRKKKTTTAPFGANEPSPHAQQPQNTGKPAAI